MSSDHLNEDILNRYLDGPFLFYNSVNSTNAIAKEWLQKNAPHGALVIADEQVQGRGRLNRQWQSPPGQAISMTMVLRDAEVIGKGSLDQLNMLVSVAVAEILGRYAEGIRLKWPNDVLLQGKKVCGILNEAEWQGNSLLGLVVGIGINIRVDFSEGPLAETAISLEPYADMSIQRAEVIHGIAENIEQWLKITDTSVVRDSYRNWLATLGTSVKIKLGQELIEGRAVDIDEGGALLVELADGGQRRITVGEIVA